MWKRLGLDVWPVVHDLNVYQLSDFRHLILAPLCKVRPTGLMSSTLSDEKNPSRVDLSPLMPLLYS